MSLDGLRMTWLGHSTWLIETPGNKRVLVDPFIGDNPACPDHYKQEGVGDIDVIICTHGHGDHIADLVPIATRTGATVVAIYDLTTWAESKGVEKAAGGNKGGTIQVEGLSVTLVNAIHSSSFMENDTLQDMGDPCGFILELENGFTIYNTGDTDVFGDMALIGELYEPDLVMMPIGGWFTMGPRQAAKAIELIGASRVVPQHYGTFPVLTGTPDELRELLGDSEVELLVTEPGGTIE